jgi:hypothetical protein
MGVQVKKEIVITQSNYIPWKGYFDAIALADVFVEYDDMQFTRRDWRNRNLIKTAQGEHWLTIPVEVKGKFFQKIRDTKISDPKWNQAHWKTISMSYSKASCFKENKDFLEEMFLTANQVFITEVNLHFITKICDYLGITTPIISSSQFELKEEKTERLLSICQELNATKYYSGPAAKDYMNEGLFADAGIEIEYFNYSGYPEYRQLYPPFQHGVSIIDLICNEGKDSPSFMKYVKNK